MFYPFETVKSVERSNAVLENKPIRYKGQAVYAIPALPRKFSFDYPLEMLNSSFEGSIFQMPGGANGYVCAKPKRLWNTKFSMSSQTHYYLCLSAYELITHQLMSW